MCAGLPKSVGAHWGPLRLILISTALLLLSVRARAFAAGPESDISREGTVQASTTTPGFPASFAIDGDPTTSWFSTGPEKGNPPPPTRFQWTHPRDDLITTIYIHGNGQNKNPSFRNGFGFGSVIVQVLNAANQPVFQQTVPLPGTPDPDVLLHPNVVGRSVLLLLSGHESNNCGGFSELRVMADRTPPTATPVPPSPAATDIPPTVTPTVAPAATSAPTDSPAAATETPTPSPSQAAKATDVPSATPSPSASATATEISGAPSGATTTATIVALNSIATRPPAGLLGDCDGDGKLTESDALCALEMSVGLRPVNLNVDMDNSGDVNSRDAVLILQKALGK